MANVLISVTTRVSTDKNITAAGQTQEDSLPLVQVQHGPVQLQVQHGPH